METLQKNKFDALTGMRAIAAIMVFVYHNRKYWRNDLPFEVMRFISEWHIGVTVFFVLSGFLLAYRYEEKPLESKKSYLKYILLRIARIFPLYWILLSALFAVTAPVFIFKEKLAILHFVFSWFFPFRMGNWLWS